MPLEPIGFIPWHPTLGFWRANITQYTADCDPLPEPWRWIEVCARAPT